MNRRKSNISLFDYIGEKNSNGEIITYQMLKEACAKLIKNRNGKTMTCRHSKHKVPCQMRGTKDSKKAPCWRRNHLEDILNVKLNSKAHLRAYHISWISEASIEQMEILKNKPSEYEIRHICGHGNLENGDGCDEQTHLQLGTVQQNEEDKHYHFILDKCKDPDQLLIVLKDQVPDLNIL